MSKIDFSDLLLLGWMSFLNACGVLSDFFCNNEGILGFGLGF